MSAAYYVCTTKSTSGHGSSGRPRRTTLYYKMSTFQPRKLRVSAAYYVCTTKVDFPATEAPGVRGVLRLYYKVDFRPRKLRASPAYYIVLQKSTFQPRKLRVSAAYCVCTTKVNFPATEHYGFSTATMRKPTEGLRLYVRKHKNTRVLAPRQRRNPQRGYVCMSKNAKTPRFWHRANAETRRGLSAATEKSSKNDGFSTATRRSPAEGCPRTQRNVKKTTVLAPRPRRNPQRVVRANQET